MPFNNRNFFLEVSVLLFVTPPTMGGNVMNTPQEVLCDYDSQDNLRESLELKTYFASQDKRIFMKKEGGKNEAGYMADEVVPVVEVATKEEYLLKCGRIGVKEIEFNDRHGLLVAVIYQYKQFFNHWGNHYVQGAFVMKRVPGVPLKMLPEPETSKDFIQRYNGLLELAKTLHRPPFNQWHGDFHRGNIMGELLESGMGYNYRAIDFGHSVEIDPAKETPETLSLKDMREMKKIATEEVLELGMKMMKTEKSQENYKKLVKLIIQLKKIMGLLGSYQPSGDTNDDDHIIVESGDMILNGNSGQFSLSGPGNLLLLGVKGDIEIDGGRFTGRLRIYDCLFDITIKDFSGQVSIRGDSGDITIVGGKGPVLIASSSRFSVGGVVTIKSGLNWLWKKEGNVVITYYRMVVNHSSRRQVRMEGQLIRHEDPNAA